MTNILDCGHAPTPNAGIGTGYATTQHEKTLCYDCAAAAQRDKMESDGKISLYLTMNKNGDNEITDWTGRLKFRTRLVRKGRHNFARVRYDVWFTVGGQPWWGVQYGDDHQIIHCKRIKSA